MSNARVNALNGKSLPTTNTKTFGHTISDRQTDPNIMQTTFVPTTVDGSLITMQQFDYLLTNNAKTADAGTTPAIPSGDTSFFVTPDLTLENFKHYQFNAKITLVLRPTTSTDYKCGCWNLVAAAKDTSLLGDEGYVLTSISSDSGIESFVPNSAIALSITSNKFKILVTPIDDISYSADMLVDLKIISSPYSHTA